MSNPVDLPQTPIEQVVKRIFESRQITRADQQMFMSVLLSKDSLNLADQKHVDRVFEALRQGRLRVIN